MKLPFLNITFPTWSGKIDNSLLQAGAEIAIAGLGGYAAYKGEWQLVGTCITGFFAVLNIHPRDPPAAASNDNASSSTSTETTSHAA